MNATRTLVLICAALWLITKVVLLQFVPFETNVQAGVMLNLFFILLIGIFAIRRVSRRVPKAQRHFLEDVKAVARGTMQYVLAAVVALALFNYVIAKDDIAARQASLRQEITEQYEDQEFFEELKRQNPQIADMSRAEARDAALDNFDQFTSIYEKWYVQLTLALLALMIAAVLYSILVTVLWRFLMS